MTTEEQRVLDLVLTEVRGLRKDVTTQGVAIARMDERLTNAISDIDEGKKDHSTLREKFERYATQAALMAYVLWDNKARWGS